MHLQRFFVCKRNVRIALLYGCTWYIFFFFFILWYSHKGSFVPLYIYTYTYVQSVKGSIIKYTAWRKTSLSIRWRRGENRGSSRRGIQKKKEKEHSKFNVPLCVGSEKFTVSRIPTHTHTHTAHIIYNIIIEMFIFCVIKQIVNASARNRPIAPRYNIIIVRRRRTVFLSIFFCFVLLLFAVVFFSILSVFPPIVVQYYLRVEARAHQLCGVILINMSVSAIHARFGGGRAALLFLHAAVSSLGGGGVSVRNG